MKATTENKTPGYNRRLMITFKYDKNGRKVAYYNLAGNIYRMSLAQAEAFIAQGQADEA